MAVAIRGYKNQKRIMKKEYIKPEIMVEEMQLEECCMLPGSDTDIPVGGEGEADSNGRRGSWGNLWED